MLRVFVLALFLSGCHVLLAKDVQPESSRPKEFKELLTHYSEQRFDGKTFAHRVDIVDGVRKERYAIDGKLVAQEEYELALGEADKNERMAIRRMLEDQRKKDDDEVLRQQQFLKKTQVGLSKKEIHQNVTKLESAFAQLKDPKLISYHVFDGSSCADLQQLTSLHGTLLSEAKMLLDQMDEVVADADFAAMKLKLDQHSKRLQSLFQSAVHNAIAMCDDTRFLKELLATLA